MKNLETPGETGRVGRYRYALISDCDVCKSKLLVHTVNYRYIQRSLLLCLKILTTVCPPKHPPRLTTGSQNNTIIRPTTKQTDTNKTQSYNKEIYITRDGFHVTNKQ